MRLCEEIVLTYEESEAVTLQQKAEDVRRQNLVAANDPFYVFKTPDEWYNNEPVTAEDLVFGNYSEAVNERVMLKAEVTKRKVCDGIYEIASLTETAAPADAMKNHLADIQAFANSGAVITESEAVNCFSRKTLAKIRQFSYYQHVPGSLIDNLTAAGKIKVPAGWRLNNLPGVLTGIAGNDYSLAGVTTSMMYLGARGNQAVCHTEDFDLPSVNLLFDSSAPKLWMGFNTNDQFKINDFLRQSKKRTCISPLLHKDLFLDSDLLRQLQIEPVYCIQKPRMMVVTNPNVFNTGPNLAEATNFYIREQPKIARRTKVCNCDKFVQYNDAGWSILKSLAKSGEQETMDAVFGRPKLSECRTRNTAAGFGRYQFLRSNNPAVSGAVSISNGSESEPRSSDPQLTAITTMLAENNVLEVENAVGTVTAENTEVQNVRPMAVPNADQNNSAETILLPEVTEQQTQTQSITAVISTFPRQNAESRPNPRRRRRRTTESSSDEELSEETAVASAPAEISAVQVRRNDTRLQRAAEMLQNAENNERYSASRKRAHQNHDRKRAKRGSRPNGMVAAWFNKEMKRVNSRIQSRIRNWQRKAYCGTPAAEADEREKQLIGRRRSLWNLLVQFMGRKNKAVLERRVIEGYNEAEIVRDFIRYETVNNRLLFAASIGTAQIPEADKIYFGEVLADAEKWAAEFGINRNFRIPADEYELASEIEEEEEFV
uniref:JmjC domain-containing protein n=1 Tax=Panagrolaimus sp. JU765 TaxID=591449 RepID=A0AC34R271_9BILA